MYMQKLIIRRKRGLDLNTRICQMSLKFRVSLVEIKNILYLKTKLKRYELICGKICGESAVCT